MSLDRGGYMKKININIGDIFDDIKLIEETKNKHGTRCFIVQCLKCNRTKTMLPETIVNRRGTKHSSCGNGLKTVNKVFYNRWQSMRTRTTNKNYEHYKDYGGRGINSDEFKFFIDFYDAMYDSFVECSLMWGENNTSLERIDVNGNYCKENCTWVHIDDQKGNQRKTVNFIAKNRELGIEVSGKNLTKFCREYGLYRSCVNDVLHGRLNSYQGWTFEKA